MILLIYRWLKVYLIFLMRKAQFIQQSTGASEEFSFRNYLDYRCCEDSDEDIDQEVVMGGMLQDDLFDLVLNQAPLHDCNEETPQIHIQQYSEEREHSEEASESHSDPNPPLETPERSKVAPEREKQKPKARGCQQSEENFYRKFKKNVNMPKAIGRYLMTYYHNYRETLFAEEKEFFEWLVREIEERKVWVRRSKKNSIKLKDLDFYFSDKVRTRRQSCLMRLMMRKIIKKWSRDEILPNNQVKDKLEYLVSAKVYGLRCTSATLATRMQMR